MKILSLISIVLLCACEKEVTKPIPPQHTITFTIDSVLNQAQTNSLPKDNNNFYHLKIDSTRTNYNNIVGTFLVDGKLNTIPSPVVGSIEWKSSYAFLTTSSNTTEIWKSYFNEYLGKWMTIKIGNYIPNSVYLYGGINNVSNISSGKVEITFKTVPEMRGDTITFVGKARYTIETPNSNLFSTYKVDSIQKSIRIICD